MKKDRLGVKNGGRNGMEIGALNGMENWGMVWKIGVAMVMG